jgi:hypothetical protein
MKKIFGILTLILLITVTACDDGEMTVKSFNFTGTVNLCDTQDNIYIKTTGSEVLIVDLSSSPLLNIAGTKPSVPVTVKYRNYSSSNGLLSVVCSTLDSPDAYVLEEWTGSGNMEIITTEIAVNSAGQKQYSHTMTFLDVSLTKGDETIRIQNTDFGTVTTHLSFEFDLASGDEVNPTQLAECGDLIYTYRGDEALLLNFAEGTFNTVEGDTIINLDGTDNYLTLKVYSSSVGTSTLCSDDAPTTPIVKERWEAIDGRIKLTKTLDTSVTPNLMVYDIYLYDDVIFYNSATTTESFTPEPTGSDADGDYYYLGQYIKALQ